MEELLREDLFGVGYLTAQRFLRDASLCNKELCISLAIFRSQSIEFFFHSFFAQVLHKISP
jgi:hypothetical protein